MTRTRRALLLLALAVAAAVPAVAATIALHKPPQQEMTEQIATDKGKMTLVYRPSVSPRDLGCKAYRGTTVESYYYQVRDAKGRQRQLVAGTEITTPDPLGRVRDYYLKALRGAKARAVGDARVGRYLITRDRGNEAIVIEATRPAGKPTTVKMRRVIQAAPR
ncbi:MAG: hypothetical protein MUP64_03205 [Anaerolineae bacterium]|nr:hypothetical protein [Anaerolineae bacterium]